MTPPDHDVLAALDRDAAFERAKRVIVCGAIATLFIGGWLLFAWHAGRLVPTGCVVQSVAGGSYCTVAHVTADGEEHTMPWERCDAPTRWPRSDVGTKLPCWFYPSFPSDIVFAPRTIAWMTPVRGAALAVSLMILAAGIVMAVRARAPAAAPRDGPTERMPYRAADRPAPSDPEITPLEVPIRHATGWLGWIISLPVAVIGIVLLGLALYLSWQTTGEVGVVGLVLIAFATVVPIFGFTGLGYRSGLVADRGRNRLTLWWGLWRPWFFDYQLLSSLVYVGVHIVRTPRGLPIRQLELRFDSGKRRFINCDDEVDAIVDGLKSYLAAR